MNSKFLILMPLLTLLAGCKGVPTRFYLKENQAVNSCFEIYDGLDKVTEATTTIDYSAARISGFPFLRTTPYFATFKDALSTEEAWSEWTARLHALAIDGFALEITHLPPTARLEYERKTLPNNLSLDEALTQCGRVLRNHLLSNPALQTELRLGVASASQPPRKPYPLGMPFFTSLLTFQPPFPWQSGKSSPLQMVTPQALGMWVYFVPPNPHSFASREEIAKILQQSSANPLHIPSPSEEELEILYDTFAPIWQIDVVNNRDLPGEPHWIAPGIPQVNINSPTVYRNISYTLWGDQSLLQLNYSIWFNGTSLHGIFWRVTLAQDGTPLMLDSFHSCDCNTILIPSLGSASVFATSPSSTFDSYLTSTTPYQQRFLVRLTSGNHFIQGVSITDKFPGGVSYHFENYWALRALPTLAE